MAKQHGVVTRKQLAQLGYSDEAVRHRLATGRLHRLHRGVYAVGRPELTIEGRWIAAVLACGPGAALSGRSAGTHWSMVTPTPHAIEVTVPPRKTRRRPGISVRARALRPGDLTTHRGIPLTTPTRTLVDLATTLRTADLERAVIEADKLDLVDPEALRTALADYDGVAGAPTLRTLLDRHTFTLTDSALEQRFLPIARRAGLPRPLTQQRVNGYRVDFFWPELGLIVETDGLRYHRTPAQQARDAARDQAHAAAGMTTLRFTHSQIRHEPERVERVLRDVAGLIRKGP